MEGCKHELREIFPSDDQLPLKENLKDEEMQQEGKYNGFQVHLGKKKILGLQFTFWLYVIAQTVHRPVWGLSI